MPEFAVDVLVISPGSTPGLRLADAELASMLHDAGATAAVAAVRVGARRLGDPFDDLMESWAARRVLRSAIDRHRPRAVIFSSPTSALLAPITGLPRAVWFDQPAPFHLHGVRNAVVRSLERRALNAVQLLLPYSAEAMRHVRAPEVPFVVTPAPVDRSLAPVRGQREDIVLTYAAGPWEKGLDLMCEAWGLIDPRPQAELVITGIEPAEARRYLAARNIVVDAGSVRFTGMLPQPEFLAMLMRARVFLTASRTEGFGLAALQALDAGAVLVGTPGEGPFPALAIARGLDPLCVTNARTATALTGALTRALAMTNAETERYRRDALGRLDPYRREMIVASLKDEVLPALFARETVSRGR